MVEYSIGKIKYEINFVKVVMFFCNIVSDGDEVILVGRFIQFFKVFEKYSKCLIMLQLKGVWSLKI